MNPEAAAYRRKAAILLSQLEEIDPDRLPDLIVHQSYYVIYHAAIAALLAAHGSAPTKHGKVHVALGDLAEERDGESEGHRIRTAVLEVYRWRVRADDEPDARPEEIRLAVRRTTELRDTVLAFCDRVLAEA